MQLEALRVVIEVAELGSFTQAGARLGMSKSRASQLVQDLEAELGVHLFVRTTRLVRPTPDGEQLVVRARRIIGEADEIGALFQGPRNLRGKVRVDMTTAFAKNLVIPRVPELLALHPELELEVSATDRRVDLVREGFDFVVRTGELHDSSLTSQRLGLLPMVNCVSPGYLSRHGMPMRIEDLDAHLIVHYATTFGARPTFEYRVGDDDVEVPMRSVIAVNNIDAYSAACVAGLGIIQVPRMGVRERLADQTLIEVLPDFTCAPMPVTLLHGHGRQVPKRVRAVMTWVASLIEPVLSAGRR